jgi:hypothetical protein
MPKLILVAAFVLLMLLGGKTLFIADEAYAACCMCGHYVRGCTPPGSYYLGQLCPVCAQPDSETLQSSAHINYGPLGMRAVRDLPLSAITRLDSSDRVWTLMRGGQCMRRSIELRLVSNAGEGLSVYQQNGLEHRLQFQIAAQAD